MAEPNLDQELIEQDELLNAFQVILKTQNTTGKSITRKKPTSLPLRSSLNTKVIKHSTICDYLKVKKSDTNKGASKDTRNIKHSGTSTIPYVDNIKVDNKESNEFKKEELLKPDNSAHSNINDDDSSPSDYLTPATANFFPLGSHQSDLNKTTDISPQFEMDLPLYDSFSNSNITINRNDPDDAMVENISGSVSGIDFNDSACEVLKGESSRNRQVESTSKEEKERMNEEIAVQSSSLSSETGSWEPIFPAKNNVEIKQICSMFIRNEQVYSQACNSTAILRQNVAKSSAFFIDAQSLVDDTEIFLSYGSNLNESNLPLNGTNIKKSTSKESNNSYDTSNEDSLELEANNTQKQSDSSDAYSTQFPVDDASIIEQACVIPRTPENSILQLNSTRLSESPYIKRKFDECVPIVSGGATVNDFAPQLLPVCKSLPTSLDPNINNTPPQKEKFIHSWIVNYDNLEYKHNAPSGSGRPQLQQKPTSETKKPLGFYVDFSKVDSDSLRESSSFPKSDKKIFSMYVDISDNKSVKEMPSSLSSSLKIRSETPKNTNKKKVVTNNLPGESDKLSKTSLENRRSYDSSSKESTPKKEIAKKNDSFFNSTITKKVVEKIDKPVIKDKLTEIGKVDKHPIPKENFRMTNEVSKCNNNLKEKMVPANVRNIITFYEKPAPAEISIANVRETSTSIEVPTTILNETVKPITIQATNFQISTKMQEKSKPVDVPLCLNKQSKTVLPNSEDENSYIKELSTSPEKRLRNSKIHNSFKSSVNRHSWNMSSGSFEGGMQKLLYQTRKSASLSHCNLKDLQKGNISKKDSNYSLSDISLGDQSYSRSEDSKTTDDTKNHNNASPKIQRKHKSDAKLNETFDKSSTCSDKLTLTQDSTPTVTDQEELTYHPEESEPANEKSQESNESVGQKFVKLSDLDKLPTIEDSDDPTPLMTNSLPVPSQKNSKIMFHSLHIENLDKLARLFPELKKELSKSSPDSMSISYTKDKSSSSKISKTDLTEASSAHTFISDLEYVFLHEIGADINIVVDHKRIIRAHKAILAARCSYFAAILATKDITEIIIDSFEYSVVHFAVLHIYSGIRTVPTAINIFLLAALADKWNLLDLKDIVSKILFTEVCHSLHRPCPLCTSNALRCLTISDNYNMDVLFKSILVWTGKHFEKIWVTEDFVKLPQHLMERCVRWVTSSIRVANLTDILHRCECIQTNVEIPRTITCFLDHVINECTDYISTNLAMVLGDQSTLRLLYPPYKNGNLLEVVLFKGAQKSSPEKLCVAIKHTRNLISLECPDESPFRKVLCRLLPHLEGTVIIKVHSIERIIDTSGWKELDLPTQERIKYFFRLIKKPTVIMVPPLCKTNNQSSLTSVHDFERPASYISRPVSRLRESSHIPILARDLEYVHIPRSTTRPTGQIHPHKHCTQDIKKPAPKTIVKLKTGQTSSGRQSPGDKMFFNKNRSLSTTSENKINADAGGRGSKLNTQNRSHPNLSHKHSTNVKIPNPKIEKPITKIKSLPSSVKQSPPVTLNKISPDTSQSSKTSTGTKGSLQNRYHNANMKTRVTSKITTNKPLNHVQKTSQQSKTQIFQNRITAVSRIGSSGSSGQTRKSIPVSANKIKNEIKTGLKQNTVKTKTIPSTSSGFDTKPSKSFADDKTKKKMINNGVAVNCVPGPADVNDIPIMERSGTFLKDEPTVLDKVVQSNF